MNLRLEPAAVLEDSVACVVLSVEEPEVSLVLLPRRCAAAEDGTACLFVDCLLPFGGGFSGTLKVTFLDCFDLGTFAAPFGGVWDARAALRVSLRSIVDAFSVMEFDLDFPDP